jgi:hypothetical protein
MFSGTLRTLRPCCVMSAFGGEADIRRDSRESAPASLLSRAHTRRVQVFSQVARYQLVLVAAW